jgi:hypothetical protein
MESHDSDPFLFGCCDELIFHLAKGKSRKIFQVAAVSGSCDCDGIPLITVRASGWQSSSRGKPGFWKYASRYLMSYRPFDRLDFLAGNVRTWPSVRVRHDARKRPQGENRAAAEWAS